MNTPGGKDGDRTRMYQPRFGLCIVQRSVDVSFSCGTYEMRQPHQVSSVGTPVLTTMCSRISSSDKNLSFTM